MTAKSKQKMPLCVLLDCEQLILLPYFLPGSQHKRTNPANGYNSLGYEDVGANV